MTTITLLLSISTTITLIDKTWKELAARGYKLIRVRKLPCLVMI
jgi:hypothetical protein